MMTVRRLTLAILFAWPAFAAPTWTGPTRGPVAQPGRTIVFIASDSRNGGVTGVFRGFEDAAARLGWKTSFLDAGGRQDKLESLLAEAVRSRPNGIIFGGFDADRFHAQGVEARKAGIVLVGWHAGPRPGPSKELFVNVTTAPTTVAALAVDFILQDARQQGRSVGVVLFTDSRFEVAKAKTRAMIKELTHPRRGGPARILAVKDIAISEASRIIPEMVPSLLREFGRDWTYNLAINDVYFDNLNFPLLFAGRPDILNISAGDGSSLALSRIGSGHSSQAATVAEPMRMQGFQLADELNRAFAGQRPSGYVSSPLLVTARLMKEAGTAGIEAGLGFEAAYLRIWEGKATGRRPSQAPPR